MTMNLTSIFFLLQAKALGKVLFEQVCRQLSLLEADYFGLEYQEQESKIKVKFCCYFSHKKSFYLRRP